MHRFLERLSAGPLVGDGAMGTQIFARLSPSTHWRSLDALNIGDADEQELIKRIHLSYIEAGAGLIETNTFGANRCCLSSFGLEGQVLAINSQAAKIARLAVEASGRKILIAGSIGPTGQSREMWRKIGEPFVVDVYREQASALEARGVDLFIAETFSDLEELVLAIEGIQKASSLPIVAQMTFTEEGVTRTGLTPTEVVERLSSLGVAVVGANCSTGPAAMLSVIEEMAAARRNGALLSVMPNVGESQRRANRVYYPASSAEYFAEFGRAAVAAGARLIGGCCGTSPQHIAALARVVEAGEETTATPLNIKLREAEETVAAHRDAPTRLEQMFAERRYVISVELDPPNGVHTDGLLETCRRLKASGLVDVVDVNDRAKVSMSALFISRAIERDIDIETIPHLTCRDHTLAGLKAALLGCYAVGGIRNILAITGDPPGVAGYPERQGVYEIDSIGLVRLMAQLNRGLDFTGKKIGGNTQFFIGVAVNPTAFDLDFEIDRFRQKIEAGAQFAMTQAIFTPQQWEAFLARLGPCPIPIMVGIWPLPSFELARYVANEVPGVVIPEEVMERLRTAGPAARQVGFELAATVLREVRSTSQGAYIIAPHKKPETALEVLEQVQIKVG
ncbi:MAG: bifunctional homocysteine S-methyltransferase/methylenetetrahydrofolate reductase [Candidatus Xenobia bacterium]